MKLRQVDKIPNFFRNEDSGIFYTKRMVNGRVVWRSTGHTAQKSAMRRHHEIMNELNNAKSGWAPKKVPTLNKWWLIYRESKKKAPSTWRKHTVMMKAHVLPQFGNIGLDEFTQSQFERHLNWRRRKVSESTVIGEQSLLHAVFQAAVDEDLIDKNPLRKIHRGDYKTRKRVITTDEEDKLLAVMDPWMQRWFTLMLGTGLRGGEIQNIAPADIDWEAPSLHVIGKGMNGEPKERDVPLLSPLLVEVLQTQIAERAGAKGLWPFKQLTIRLQLATLCKTVGVPKVIPHNLRHTFATRYLQSGGSIFVLSKILGHYSVAITERVYAHLLTADHAKLSQHVNLQLVYKARA